MEKKDDLRNKKTITAEDLEKFLPQYFEKDGGAPFPLTVTGGSMAPFLIGGRDTALLTPFTGDARRGDILLFFYGDRLLLHRVCAVKDGELWFMGDAHTYSEGPVRQQAVLARCDSAVRDGKLVSRHNTLWKFYEHLWAEKPEARDHLLKAAGIIKKK